MAEAVADLLLTSARIDVRADGSPPETTMAIGAGKVLALGRAAEQFVGNRTVRLDLAGQAVLPGFVDVHNHHSLAGQAALSEVRVASDKPLDLLLEAVREFAVKRPGADWIVGGSWSSHELSGLNTAEARRRLDAAAPGRKVMLRDDSIHNRWVSPAALRRLGIDAGSADPEGGKILHAGDGEPSGVLLERAAVLADLAIAQDQPFGLADLERFSAHAVGQLHSHGITAFQDGASSLQQMEALASLDRQGRLKAWVVTSMLANDPLFGVSPLGEGIIGAREQTRSAHHRPDFVKIFLDGVPPAGTACFLQPYPKSPVFPDGGQGEPAMDDAELRRWLRSTAERGIGAKVHCTGDAAVRTFLDAVEEVRAAGLHTVRYQLAHGQFIDPADLPRLAELGVAADISPGLWYPGPLTGAIAQVLGEPRGSRLHPNRDLLDSGALLGVGSDWQSEFEPNVFQAVYGLVTRQDPQRRTAGSLWPEQAISLREALAAVTGDAARICGLDDVAGTLSPGRSADLVVLESSPYELPVEALPDLQVAQTWFAGEQVFERR